MRSIDFVNDSKTKPWLYSNVKPYSIFIIYKSHINSQYFALPLENTFLNIKINNYYLHGTRKCLNKKVRLCLQNIRTSRHRLSKPMSGKELNPFY